jgi:ABC-type nitrate/sulfonate/bicarbonate transport system permease component
MNATPRVALPLIIIWLGIGIPSKVGIIFLGAIFPIFMNARDGVKTTPQELVCEIGFRDLPGTVQC